MELDDFVSKLDGVRRAPKGISARCPAHDDHVASLSVNTGKKGGIVVRCHAGCTAESVVAAMGLQMGDLMGLPYLEHTYDYVNDAGNLVHYSVEKWQNPKTFRCVPYLPPVAQRVLYRSDALAWARERHATVYVVEGEKDADRLAELGLVSTTNPNGSEAWFPHYAQQVEGCHVIVIADNDVPGRRHAREVADSCRTTAASVVTTVPRYGKDVSELLDLGWTLDALEPLSDDDALGLVRADNVIIRPVSWAWPGYVAFGKVTIVEGDPGDGKSVLTTDLAARWTSGMTMPDGARHDGPWPVIMVTAEDDAEDTIAPRLQAGGADLRLVHLLDHGSDPTGPFNINKDMRQLERTVLETGARIVTLDPLMAMLGDGTDSHNDSSVRRALFPLYQMARDTGAAVVVVRHLNKGSGGKAVYRGGGSIGFTGMARAVFAVGRDPEQPGRRVLANTKMNIAPQPPSLSYSIEQGMKGPYLEWHGTVDANAQEILDGVFRMDDTEMIHFLNTVVENGEPMAWRDIVKKGKEEGFTDKQLTSRRGRSRLVMIMGKEGRRSTRWGYLEHTLAISPDQAHGSPQTPKSPIQGVPTGGSMATVTPIRPAEGTPQIGNKGDFGGEREVVGNMDDEDRLIEELESRPLQCEICSGGELVNRWAAPYWAVRCSAHSPMTYGSGQ